MANNKKKEQQPFHETILARVKRVRSKKALKDRAEFIIDTKVPAGHRQLIEALQAKAKKLKADMPALRKAICVLKTAEKELAEKALRNPDNLLFEGPYLEKGSKGAPVAVLQLVLKALGCNPKIEPDGDFGDETEKGVRLLQDAYGIEVDGKCGPDTRKKILERTGINLNTLSSDLFKGKTITVPPVPWVEPKP